MYTYKEPSEPASDMIITRPIVDDALEADPGSQSFEDTSNIIIEILLQIFIFFE